MRIEDKIRELQVQVPSRHKEVLRARLLARMEEKPVKSRSFNWMFVAVPLTAVLLLAVLSVLQFTPSKNPNVVQKTLEPLTAKQVFAAASDVADRNATLASEQVYYQKLKRTVESGDCSYIDTDFMATYTNSKGDIIKRASYNANDKLSESVIDKDGDGKLESDFFDQAAAMETRPYDYRAQCPPAPVVSDKDSAEYERHLKAVGEAFGSYTTKQNLMSESEASKSPSYQALLSSGNPKVQADTLRKLESTNEWKVAQNVVRPDLFSKNVIQLSFNAGPYLSEKLFFSQSNKAYLGSETYDWYSLRKPFTQVVVEQGARPLSEALKLR